VKKLRYHVLALSLLLGGSFSALGIQVEMKDRVCDTAFGAACVYSPGSTCIYDAGGCNPTTGGGGKWDDDCWWWGCYDEQLP
jgi:hypothetical protein